MGTDGGGSEADGQRHSSQEVPLVHDTVILFPRPLFYFHLYIIIELLIVLGEDRGRPGDIVGSIHGSTGAVWGQCRCPDKWNSLAALLVFENVFSHCRFKEN